MATESTQVRTLPTALILLANLGVLMATSVAIAVHTDTSADVNSASPVTDGVITTILVVMALVLVNGILFCLSARTRRLGIGAIIALLVSIPIGLVVSLSALTSLLGDS